uniref:rod shape-determining protein MreD n=1 Tax=Candidatus Planktophila sp. TaxID=2175601 RepID=UPI00404B6C5F
MSTRKISLTATLFLFIYILQEAFITQLRIAGGGFSLFLIFTLLWAALSSPNMGALTGFAAGLLIDLSQSTAGVFGQWTLVLILIGFGISYFGLGYENVRLNPFTITFLLTISVFIARVVYLLLSLLLGKDLGTFSSVATSLLIGLLWSAAVVPIAMPAVARAYDFINDTRSRL